MDRVYRRIDAALTGKLGRDPLIDPFEPRPRLAREQTPAARTLDRDAGPPRDRPDRSPSGSATSSRWRRAGGRPDPAPGPGAPARPRARPGRRRLPARRARRGARPALGHPLPGLPDPVEVRRARWPSLREHGHCEACHLDYELDFGRSVELIFRAHPEIRESDLGTYCIGGPAHSPHVVAQVRVGAGERLDPQPGPGRRAVPPDRARSSASRSSSGSSRAHPIKSWDLTLREAGKRQRAARRLRAGGAQRLGLTNDSEPRAGRQGRADRPPRRRLDRRAGLGPGPLPRALPRRDPLHRPFVSLETMTLVVTELDDPDGLYQRHGRRAGLRR